MVLASAAVGMFAGVVLFFFSHVAPIFGAGNFVRDLDEPRLFGKSVTRREAHLVGALAHILLAGASGGVFGFLVSSHVFPGFNLLSLLGWSLVTTLFIGGVVMPLEGHGVFGVKEDAWFPVDLLVTQALWGILFWWIMKLWPSGF